MVSFQAYRRPLEIVAAFKHLVQVITVSDENWPEMVENIRKDRSRWKQLSRILWWERS